jgi:hypothetical protein
MALAAQQSVQSSVKFEVFTTVKIWMEVFWAMMP